MATFEIDVKCETCGYALTEASTNHTYNGDITIRVEPCEHCLDAARDEGVKEGRAEVEE